MELVKTLSAPTDVTSLQFLPGSSRELWAMTGLSSTVSASFLDRSKQMLQIFRENLLDGQHLVSVTPSEQF